MICCTTNPSHEAPTLGWERVAQVVAHAVDGEAELGGDHLVAPSVELPEDLPLARAQLQAAMGVGPAHRRQKHLHRRAQRGRAGAVQEALDGGRARTSFEHRRAGVVGLGEEREKRRQVPVG